jgi:hypothetical protein
MRWVEVEEDLPTHGLILVIYDREDGYYAIGKWSASKGWVSMSGRHKFDNISHYLEGSEQLFTMHTIKLEHKVNEEKGVEE